MDHRDIKKILAQTGLPVAYGVHRTPKKPPYLDYSETVTTNVYADNVRQSSVTRWRVRLFTDGKDPRSEKLVESALDKALICWDMAEAGIDDEGILMLVYEFPEVEHANFES